MRKKGGYGMREVCLETGRGMQTGAIERLVDCRDVLMRKSIEICFLERLWEDESRRILLKSVGSKHSEEDC